MHVEDTNANERVGRARGQGPLWVIAVSLAVIAVCLLLRLDGAPTPAFAQPMGQAGARGIFAFPGQFSKDHYGLFMVDVDTMTLWCYEYLPGTSKLRLVAGRSWMFDRYLEQFGTDPPPDEIQRLVETARETKLRQRGKP